MRHGEPSKKRGWTATAGLLSVCFTASCLFAAEIEVSSSSDAATCRERIAELRKKNPTDVIHVRFSAGDYFLPEGLSLDKRHTPDGAGALVFSSSGPVRLFGGTPVTGWQKRSINGCEAWVAPLPAAYTNGSPELFVFGGKKMERARWPNVDLRYPYSGGWAYVAGTPVGMHTPCPGADRRSFTVAEKRTWHDPSEGLICLFPQFNWINEVQKIKSYDPATGRLESDYPFRYELRPGNRYCVIGLREELDASGEWYCDVKEKKLWFIPPDEVDPNGTPCILPGTRPVFDLDSVHDVTITGFDISAAAAGIEMRACRDVTVEGCRIHDIGFFYGSAVTAKDAERCVVRDCDIWHIGKHGVSMSGGDEKTLEKSDNKIENCYIHHCGQVDRHGIGVVVGGQGATVSHCLIHDMPRCAVMHRGRLHTIAYNVIRHTNLEMEDTGAIYGGGWTSGAGTKIIFNRISDTIGFAERNGRYRFHFFASGIHLDEGIGGVEVSGNFIEKSNLAALNFHNARFITVSNNFFVSNAGKEGYYWQLQFEGWNSKPKGYFVKVRQKAVSAQWRGLIDAQAAWKRFPSLAHSPENPFLPDGNVMQGIRVTRNVFHYPDQPSSLFARLRDFNFQTNVFSENVICSSTNVRINVVGKKRLSWDDWRAAGMDRGSVLAEAGFVDAKHGDWRLKAGSPAKRLGIADLPFDEMGLRPTRWRAGSFREAEGVREHPEWLALPTAPVEISVSAQKDGTLDFPSALKKVEEVRRKEPATPVTLIVPEGDYAVANEIRIDGRHARRGWGRLTIRPAKNARVRLFGGRDAVGWVKTEFNGCPDVWCSDVTSWKLGKRIGLLFFDAARMENARYPNQDPVNRISGGWAYVAGAVQGDMYKDNNAKDRVPVRLEDWRSWADPAEGGVVIIPRYNWFTFQQRIIGVDTEKRVLTLAHDLWYSPRGGDRYYAWGHVEDFDAPGEWYHDLKKGRLYFIPPNGEDPNRYRISVPVSRGVFRFEKAAEVLLEGFEISAAENGITGSGCARIVVSGCRIHGVGGINGDGISLRESRHCIVSRCDVRDIGREGIVLGGGTPDSLERSGNLVVANRVSATGRVNRHSCGILLNGQGARVTCNDVRNVPRIGICPHGRMHMVDRNRIIDTNLESEDCGAVYLGGYTSPGTHVVGNWISGSKGFGRRNGKWATPYFARGIHLDEAVGDVVVAGNVIEGSAQGALCLHAARYVSISNNVFLSNATQGGGAPQIDFHGWTDATNGLWRRSRRISAIKAREKLLKASPEWKRFPSLAADPSKPLEDGYLMRGVVVTDNVFYYADQPESPLMWAVHFKTNACGNAFVRNVVLDKKPDLEKHPAFHAGVPKEEK